MLFINNYKLLLLAFLIFCISILPQILYWNSTFGKFLLYSYGNESFSNLMNPQILVFLFSTNNGWITYTPFMLFAFLSVFWMLKNKKSNAFQVILISCICVYLFSSWWIPTYGCSYGMRVMVEYYPLFILPLAQFANHAIHNFRIWQKILTTLFVVICIVLNIDIIYYYDGCFYGGTWDLQAYMKLLEN